MIRTELYVGAKPNEIEAFFKRHKIFFVWNRFIGQHDAIIRDVEPYRSITTDVFVRKARRYLRAEDHDTHTLLESGFRSGPCWRLPEASFVSLDDRIETRQ